MANSVVVDSPPQLPSAGAWASLFAVREHSKSRHVPPSAAKKKPAYGVKRNLAMCTEALGCETGGVDTTAYDADEGTERKRQAREEKEETKVARRARVLPPPLTTLAAGASRVRMVHERRGGRLEVYAVRASGMEADRSGGRLRLRFLSCDGCNCNAAACSSEQEPPQEAEEVETEEAERQKIVEEEHMVAKYMRRGRCLKVKSGAMAASCGTKWEPEQAAAFWVAIT